MDDPTALDWSTLAIAILGALTGVAALGAPVWSVLLAGPRVRVKVANALRSDPGADWELSVDASNLGRLPVTIVESGVAFRAGGEWKRMPIGLMHTSQWSGGPRGAHRLPDAEAITWMINAQHVASDVTKHGVQDVGG